jgi:RND family efflux transporter MFP subunit
MGAALPRRPDAPDLDPLRIDRGGRARRRRRSPLRRAGGWLVALLVVGALAWLFRTPLTRFVDRLRLPEVSATRATRTSPFAASAVSGTAANGYVVASKRAALSADTPGRIVEMNVEEGTVVRRGDVVARLYSEEYEAALRRAEAELESSKAAVVAAEAEAASVRAELESLRAQEGAATARVADAEARLRWGQQVLERAVKLRDDGVQTQDAVDAALAERDRATAQLDAERAALAAARAAVTQGGSRVSLADARLEQARSQVSVAVAARDLARATLDKTAVRAPFDGVVVLKDAEVGEVVSPNSQGASSRGSVATMVDFDSLEVQVELPETSLSAVRVGEPANVYLDAYPQSVYAGRVERIWPTANRQKATVEIRISFDEPDERLRPEMGVRVVFSPREPQAADGEAAEVVLIPVASVVRLDGRAGVFVLERDVARWRAVELGAERGKRVAVASGLAGGELVVASPPPNLADGDRVRLQEE